MSNKTDQGEFRFNSPYFIEAMSHLMTREMLIAKVGVRIEERETYRTDFPVFSVNEAGGGIANGHTEAAMYENITKAALLGSRMTQAALRAVSNVNAHMREHNKMLRRFTVALHQDTYTRPGGHVETIVRVRIERVE